MVEKRKTEGGGDNRPRGAFRRNPGRTLAPALADSISETPSPVGVAASSVGGSSSGIDGSVGNGRGGSSSGIERGVDNPSIAPTQFLDKPMKCLSGLACPLPQADFVWIWTASQQKCHRERYGDKCAAPVRCLECRKKHKERHHNIRRI